MKNFSRTLQESLKLLQSVKFDSFRTYPMKILVLCWINFEKQFIIEWWEVMKRPNKVESLFVFTKDTRCLQLSIM